MPLVIDPLSVATQGYLETPGLTQVEASRDILRVATLGWILVDFVDLAQDTEAIIASSCSTAIIVDSENEAELIEFCSTAIILSNKTELSVFSNILSFDVEDSETEAVLSSPYTKGILEANVEGATIRGNKASPVLEPPDLQADVKSGKTKVDK